MCYWLELGDSAFQEVTEIKTACHSRGPTDKTQPLGRKGGGAALAITKQVRPLSVAMRIFQQGHSEPVSASGCQLHNRLAECGDQVHFLPPKRTSWRLRSQVITDRQRGNKSRIVLSRPVPVLRLEGSPRSRVAVVARSPQAMLRSALPANFGAALIHRTCVPVPSELLIRVLFFKQTIFLPDFIVS